MSRRAVGAVGFRAGSEQAEHIAGAQVEGTLVGMEAVAVVPVDAVETEGDGRQQEGQQQKVWPPQAMQGGRNQGQERCHGSVGWLSR